MSGVDALVGSFMAQLPADQPRAVTRGDRSDQNGGLMTSCTHFEGLLDDADLTARLADVLSAAYDQASCKP